MTTTQNDSDLRNVEITHEMISRMLNEWDRLGLENCRYRPAVFHMLLEAAFGKFIEPDEDTIALLERDLRVRTHSPE